jgi:hypothetical protein
MELAHALTVRELVLFRKCKSGNYAISIDVERA